MLQGKPNSKSAARRPQNVHISDKKLEPGSAYVSGPTVYIKVSSLYSFCMSIYYPSFIKHAVLQFLIRTTSCPLSEITTPVVCMPFNLVSCHHSNIICQEFLNPCSQMYKKMCVCKYSTCVWGRPQNLFSVIRT